MWPEILINRWPGHRPWVGTLRRACKNVSLCLGAGVSYQFGGGDLVTKSYPTFANPCSVACQAPLSMEFSRQEYWSGLSFPSPGDLPNPGIEPGSPALQVDSSLTEPTGKPIINLLPLNYKYILCYLLSDNADGSFTQRTVLSFIITVHWGDLEEEAFLSCLSVCVCVYTIAIIQSHRDCDVLNITGAPPQLSAQKCSPLQTCSPGLVTTSLWPSWYNSACNLHRHTYPPT